MLHHIFFSIGILFVSQVLIHGCIVTESNVESMLLSVHTKLMDFQARVIDKVEDVMKIDSFYDTVSSIQFD